MSCSPSLVGRGRLSGEGSGHPCRQHPERQHLQRRVVRRDGGVPHSRRAEGSGAARGTPALCCCCYVRAHRELLFQQWTPVSPLPPAPALAPAPAPPAPQNAMTAAFRGRQLGTPTGRVLHGANVLIIGFGAIGAPPGGAFGKGWSAPPLARTSHQSPLPSASASDSPFVPLSFPPAAARSAGDRPPPPCLWVFRVRCATKPVGGSGPRDEPA